MYDVLKTDDNKSYPVRVSYRLLKRISIEDGEKLEDQYGQVELLLHLALKEGHAKAEMPFDMKVEDIETLIDDYPELLGQFNKLLATRTNELASKMTGEMGGQNLSV